MRKLPMILIASVLGFFLTSCTRTPEIVTETVYVETPIVAPIVPRVDVLSLRPVDWIIVNSDNVDSVLAENSVLFALTTTGYENLALNISDIRAIIDQYKAIIRIYEESYE